MAVSLVNHVLITGGSSGGTSGSIDTTGATLLVVVIAQQGTDVTVSDSKGNSWTGLTVRGTTPKSRIWYAANPTVGTGHTFTISGASTFSAGAVQAFSGVVATSPFESQNGATGTTTTIQTGSVTPGENGALLVAAVAGGSGFNGTVTLAIDSGFTKTNGDDYLSANYYGVGAAYLVQTSAAAVNPTWSAYGSPSATSAAIAVFKPLVVPSAVLQTAVTINTG